MKSEKIKAKSPPPPGHCLGAASTSPTKTGESGEFHPLDGKPSSIIDETVNFWKQRTGKKLSRDEAREAVANMAGFFQILLDWNYKIQKEDSGAEALTSTHNVRRMTSGKRIR